MIGSLLAFTVFGYMLRVAPLPLVTTYAYVNPVVAVILGAIVLGEVIDVRTVVAGTIIVVAVALIVTARGRMTRHERPRCRHATRSGRWRHDVGGGTDDLIGVVRRAPSPGRATARNGAAGPRDSRARSRPG